MPVDFALSSDLSLKWQIFGWSESRPVFAPKMAKIGAQCLSRHTAGPRRQQSARIAIAVPHLSGLAPGACQGLGAYGCPRRGAGHNHTSPSTTERPRRHLPHHRCVWVWAATCPRLWAGVAAAWGLCPSSQGARSRRGALPALRVLLVAVQ